MKAQNKTNKSRVFKNAWHTFKTNRQNLTFAECLKIAWSNEKKSINGIKVNNKTLNFDTIYKEYRPIILGQLKQQVKNYVIAEELCNDIFLKVYDHLSIFDVSKSKFSTWLFNITKNVVIDYYRTNKANQQVNISDYVDQDGNEYYQIVDRQSHKTVENNELNSTIQKAINELKPQYRSIANLLFNEEKQYNEIAEILNIPINSVKVYINRIKTELQSKLSYNLLTA